VMRGMDIGLMKERLRSGIGIVPAEKDYLREVCGTKGHPKIDRAIFLLYRFPDETGVSHADRKLFEHVFDNTSSTHARALALSVLCNWLSLAAEEIERLLIAIADRTYEDEDFLCIKACSLSALALIEKFDSRLARGLLDVFYDAGRPLGTQETALDALLTLDGMNTVEIERVMEGDPAMAQQRAEAVAKRLEAQIARTVDN
jgi:hypothetical protein